jgi:hypothetical protein
MSQNAKKMWKTSGHDVTKGLKAIMEHHVTIVMGKMDMKYVRLKCNQGRKCHKAGQYV